MKMKGGIFYSIGLMLTAVSRCDALMGVDATALSTNFSTENVSFDTPLDPCEECIKRARDYYHRTVSDPEEFCITNHLCVENPNFDTLPPSVPTSDGPSLPAAGTESTDLEASTTNDNENQSSIPVSAPMIPAANSSSPVEPPTEPANGESNISDETPLKTSEEPLSTDAIDVDADATNNDEWRTTISSIFLKNLTSTMDQEVSDIFSIVALDFLRDHSMSGALAGKVDFVAVEVMGQGQDYGNSTEFDMHVDGVNVFFETLVTLEDNSQIDLPRSIESIFKHNKNDFFFRLVEENDYFVPLYGEVPIVQEIDKDRFEFLLRNRWVAASLAAGAGSVLLFGILLATRGKRARVRRDYRDATKQDTYPLYTLEQTCSEGSSPTNKSGDIPNPPSYKSDAADILKSLESDSLVGLKLIHSEAINTPSVGGYEKNRYEPKRSQIETESDGDDESVASRARMRKRQIERDFEQRRSEAGTTMGAILIATESLKSEDDVEEQEERIEVVVEEKVEILKCESLASEAEQKSSFMDQVTTIFRPKSAKKKQEIPRLEPVRINPDYDSDLSLLSTPHSTISKLNTSYETPGRRGLTEEENDVLPKGILRSPFSPVIYTNFTRDMRNHPSPGDIRFISSPTSKAIKRKNTTTPKGYYHS